MDRALYKRLAKDLGCHTKNAMLIVALWLVLEKNSKLRICNLELASDNVIKALAAEALAILNCIGTGGHTFLGYYIDIPWTRCLSGSHFTLQFFYDNRHLLIHWINRYLNEVCLIAFDDISKKVNASRPQQANGPFPDLLARPIDDRFLHGEQQQQSLQNNHGEASSAATGHPAAGVFPRPIDDRFLHGEQRQSLQNNHEKPLSEPTRHQAVGVFPRPIDDHFLHGERQQQSLQNNHGEALTAPTGHQTVGVFPRPVNDRFLHAEQQQSLQNNHGRNEGSIPHNYNHAYQMRILNERGMYLTFSEGYSVSEDEIRGFFLQRNFGNCIEAIFFEEVQSGKQALRALVVFRHHIRVVFKNILDDRRDIALNINGKYALASKYARFHQR